MWIRRRTLGLAVTSKSISAIEIDNGDGRPRAVCGGRFTFPEGLDMGQPVSLGKALKSFLRREGFAAARCVIGLEGKRLMARKRVLPPSSGEATADILKLMVERESTSGAEELLWDYAGPSESPGRGRQAVLFAAVREQVNRAVEMAAAAGLEVLAVTSSTAALASEVARSKNSQCIALDPTSGGLDVAVLSDDGLPTVLRLSSAMPLGDDQDAQRKFLEDLTAELGRLVAMLPQDDVSGQQVELIIPADAGLSEAEIEGLAARLSLAVGSSALPDSLDGGEVFTSRDWGTYGAAACLALAGLPDGKVAIDFVHSRLTETRKPMLGRQMLWAGGAVAAMLMVALALLLAWRSNVSEAQAIEESLAGMSGDLAQAEQIVEKTSLARGWYSDQPRFLECMKELTLAFPAEGRIWTTSLAIEEDMRVVFSGKAINETAVLEVLDHLRDNSRFADVKPLYLRESSASRRDVAFAMSCRFEAGS